MKIIPFILLAVFLMACNSNVPEDLSADNTILLKASGLTGPVSIVESISNSGYEIASDGNHTLTLPSNQTIYNLEIIQTNQQACSINQQLDLVCDSIACTAEVNPVCAKKPLAGAVCITSPCQTDRYLTYSNACSTQVDNAWIALESACGGLEDVIAFHQKPVVITNLALIDLFTDNFQVNQSEVIDDALIVEFAITGGCGSHDFTLYADEVFQESEPVQLTVVIGYNENDTCNRQLTIEKEFDLLPIKEIYRRAYPDATGEQTVNLVELGLYQFFIN